MIIKRGYHRLITVNGISVEGPLVVETTKDGKFLSYHMLRQEEDSTEWVGGIYDLKKQDKATII